MTQEMIKAIRTLRVSTAEMADAMGKTGLLREPCGKERSLFPLTPGLLRVGEVQVIWGTGNSNWQIHKQLAEAELEGKIPLIIGFDCEQRSLIGHLTTTFLIEHKKAEAVIVVGDVRDSYELKRSHFPVWAAGVNPVGCSNQRTVEKDEFIVKKYLRDVSGLFGIAICDDDGVVVVPNGNEELYQRMLDIRKRECSWYNDVARGKSTFDVVCTSTRTFLDNICAKCGVSVKDKKQKYCGDGSNKDNEHQWVIPNVNSLQE